MTTTQVTDRKRFKNNGNVQRVLAALAEYGPLSRDDLQEELGLTSQQMYNTMYGIRDHDKIHGKRVYIVKYIRSLAEHYVSNIPVYALGDLPDAPKPAKQARRNVWLRFEKKRAARRARDRANSVFNLANLSIGARNGNRI